MLSGQANIADAVWGQSGLVSNKVFIKVSLTNIFLLEMRENRSYGNTG